jgi:glycolate oxidase iron-sulfur subunit
MGFAELAVKETGLCVKCGACRSVCPIISVINRESSSARGKIELTKRFMAGEGNSSKKFNDAINQCLLCMLCSEVCANRVRTDRIILAVRTAIEEQNNAIDEITRFLKTFAFTHQKSLSSILKLLQKILMKRDYGEDLQSLRFQFKGFRGRYFPVLKGGTFLSRVKKIVNGEKNTKYAFFVGCMLNLAYQDIADKTHKLLLKTGGTVVTPEEQLCCGLPMLAEGDLKTARSMALKNTGIFGEIGVDRVVVACASCGSMLKEYYPYIFYGTEYEERARNFAKKIIDISELLVSEKPDFKKSYATSGVTFHDPCHLKRGMGVYEEPRELIVNNGYEFKEMNESDRCCGFSGSFSFKYPELSNEILKRKIENALSTGADTIVTSCPGCIMQLKSGVKSAEANLRVKHLVELIE